MEARLPSGMSVFFVKDIDKRPRVNTFFQNLATELNSRGITARRIERADNYDRGVVIIYDIRNSIIDGTFAKIRDSQVIRFLILMTPDGGEDIEDDFTKIREATIKDPQGAVTLQVWKRIKQRIL